MTVSNLRKRLDAVENRLLTSRAFVFLNQHPEQPADGGPYRKVGESTEACRARYGIDPRRDVCIFLNMTGIEV